MEPSSRSSANGVGADYPQISLAYLPPTPQQTRSALIGAGVLLLGLAALAPFAGKPLPQVNVFIPALDAIIFVTDLITASLFLAHFSITRSRALLALACGYLFLALIVIAHSLTFPGVFSPAGDLSRDARINFMIYLVWHLGLPVALFAYLWVRDKDRSTPGPRATTAIVATYSVAGVSALVGCLVWLAAAVDKLLPAPFSTFQPFPPKVSPWLISLTMLLCASALLMLFALRRSVLDQWLMVVMLASMVELAITGWLGWHHFEHSHGIASRFTLGFYTGRVLFSLLTSTVVLIALLAETTKLYAGVARASMLARILNASRALSSEIELANLIDRLMAIAIENAGADHALLILRAGDEYFGRAEARAIGDRFEVALRHDPMSGIAYPESLIRHVIRTHQRVILDDASTANQFSGDDYLRHQQSKSILCLPLIKQSELIGILLLENTLTSHAFTPARVAVLELLAVQAAISLENARLYSDLQRSEAFLAQGQRISHTGSFGRNVLSEKLYWSEETYKIYELDRSVEPTLGWLIQRIHPDDRVRVQQKIEYAVHQRTGFDVEYRLVVQDNALKYLHVVVQARENSSGELEFVGAVTDVTGQQQLMQKLQRSQHYLTEGQRLARTGSFSWCLETNEIIWSRELYRIFEFDERLPVTLERIGSRVYPDDLPLLQDMLDRARSGANDFEYQHRLLMPDQSVKHIHLYGHVDRDEFGRLEYVGAAQDVTEFHTITDAIANPVVVLTPDGKTVFANKMALNELKFTPSEARVEGFFPRACHPEDTGRVREECDAGLLLGAPFDLEMRLLSKGKYRWQLIKYNPLKDESGKIIRWYATATDIDDQKRTEEALRQAQSDLARINRVTTMGELAASLVHELAQPISGAITTANVCLRKLDHDKPDLDEVRLAVARIARDTQRGAEIITRIRSQFVKGAPQQLTLDVNEIILETIALLRDEAVRYGISVRTELASDLAQIVGDRVQLQQVVMNLIVNSIEAMKNVAGKREMVMQSQQTENRQILVSISDTGPGIPPELVEQIFVPFFTTKVHGTGMGLRISRSIIESHGGRLWAVSSPGRGASFHLTMPATTPPSGKSSIA